ncbi:MAG: hypothetical protein LBU85_07835 [Treponema sp.]|jgi:hypothetical protein|nr:hypothetical protein [Treponema sp.]
MINKNIENDLLITLRLFIRNNGIKALDDIKGIGNFIYSNTNNDTQNIPECEALMMCIILGYHKKLLRTNEQKRFFIKKDILEKLNNNEEIDINICNKTLDILEAALFDTVTPVEETEIEVVPFDEYIKIINESNNQKQIIIENEMKINELELIISNKAKQNNNLIEEINELKNQKVYNKNIITTHDNTLISKDTWNYGEYMSLAENFENVKKEWIINIVDMKVGNAYKDNKWITKPGVKLKASAVNYLNPVFIYDSQATCIMTFFIKIIDPNGKIIFNKNTSPKGYTYSNPYQVKKGQSLEYNPGGWGTKGGGSYFPGVWKIELWSEGFCLYSGEINLEE